MIRRNDTLKGDGNPVKYFSSKFIYLLNKKKRYSERRRKLVYSKTKFLKNSKIRRNDTLKGDGNFPNLYSITNPLPTIRRNDTLKGDGNLEIKSLYLIPSKR